MENNKNIPGNLSLCMMVKNEERCILRAIQSVKQIVDEIIVVDTGSTDQTVQLAMGMGAKIIHYEWDNDYPKIRNLGLRAATSRWILVLDADEVLDPKDISQVELLIQEKDIHGYQLIQKTYTNRRTYQGWMPCKPDDPEYRHYAGYIHNPICRLFQNRPDIFFENILHELVEPSILRMGGRIASSSVAILHYGHDYFQYKPDKWDNYIASGVKDIKHNPASARPHRDMGIAMMQTGRYEDAITEFLVGMQKDPDTEHLRYNLGVAYHCSGRSDQAMEHFSKVLPTDPCFLDARNNLACLLIDMHRYEDAERELEMVLKKDPNMLFAHFNLGIVLQLQGRLDATLEELLKVERVDPAFPNLCLMLADIYCSLGVHTLQNKRLLDALSFFEDALKRAPCHKKSLLYSAKILISLRRLEDANNRLARYRDVYPEDSEVVDLHKRLCNLTEDLRGQTTKQV